MQDANNEAWIRNPLTVIAIFAAVAESFGAGVLPFLEGEVQEIFVVFVMFFPCALVGLFFFVLWFKPEALYAPADFKTDAAYLHNRGFKVFNTSGSDKDPQPCSDYESPSSEAGAEAAPPAEVVDNASDSRPERNGSETLDNKEDELSAAAHSHIDRTRSDPKTTAHDINNMLAQLVVAGFSPGLQDALKTNEEAWDTILKHGVSQLAESMAVSNIAKRFGGQVTAPAIVQADDKPMEIDAFIDSPIGPIAIEVLTGPPKSLIFKAKRASQKLGIMRNSMPPHMREKFHAIVAVVSASAQEHRQFRNALKNIDSVFEEYEIIYLNLEDLLREANSR